jgi:hypothetical protein
MAQPAKDALWSEYLYLIAYGQDQETYKQEADFTWKGVKVVLCSLPIKLLLRSEAESVNQ